MYLFAPIGLRNSWEQLLRLARIHEEQRKQVEFSQEGFELWETGLPIIKDKSYPHKRHLATELDLVVTHVTDVKGGFGVSRKRVKHWSGLIDGELLSAGMLEQLSRFAHTKPLDLAQRIALWERFHGTVPYHQIGAANGDNIANRKLEDWTWHGGRGNYGVGWALDCSPRREPLADWLIETGRASLKTLIYRVLVFNGGREVNVTPHRAFSYPGRAQDPGKAVTKEVILPVVQSIPEARLALELANGGAPWPNTWVPGALYDAKGKRIR